MSVARTELKALWALAVPIVIANLGTQLMAFVDAIFVGKHSDAGLRATTLAHVWIFGTSMLAMGVVFGMDPIVSQSHGAKDGDRVGRTLQRGLVLSVLLGIPLALCWAFTEEVLVWIYHLPGVETPADIREVAALAQRYAGPQMWTAPCYLAFLAQRQYLQGRGILAPVVVVLFVSNVFNAVFDWIWIPEHGVYGAGIATALTRGLFPLLLWFAIVRGRHHVGAWVPWTKRALRPAGLWDIVRIGVPIGIQLSLEMWAFGACTLMAGALGEAATNAHSAVLHMASITFMLPMGVALATTTRVGNLIGEGRKDRAQTTAWLAFAVGAGVMALAAGTFFLGRHQLPHLILRGDSDAALALATTILPIAAAFQVFDGLQVVGSGVLRGMGTTRPAAVANLIGYWVIALPLGYWFAFHGGWGLPGVWWGLVLALALVAALLIAWIRVRGPATLDDSRLLTRESG
jgi:MATE family multidrug resistance protein